MNKHLEEKLKQYITMFPEEAPIYLNIISEAMSEYKKWVDEQRNITAIHALSEMLAFDKVKKFKNQTKVPFIINTAFILFPKGNCDGHSSIVRDFYKLFVEIVKEENTLTEHKEWLISVYGTERYEWLKNLMESRNES